MYTWGYIKASALAKLDLSADEANATGLINKFSIFANEAMTHICSSIKPNRTFATITIWNNEEEMLKDLRSQGTDEEVIAGYIAAKPYVNTPVTMPSDFISFGNDVCTYDTDECVDIPCTDEDMRYIGYNRIKFYHTGKFTISYNARWFDFYTSYIDDDTYLTNVPDDIADCLPSYIASQCYKPNDEIKATLYRNEYEVLLSRIDATDYSQTKVFTIGGNW